jgi:hypothetical protein
MIAIIYFFADRLAVALVTAFKNLIGGLSFKGRVGKVKVEATFTTMC